MISCMIQVSLSLLKPSEDQNEITMLTTAARALGSRHHRLLSKTTSPLVHVRSAAGSKIDVRVGPFQQSRSFFLVYPDVVGLYKCSSFVIFGTRVSQLLLQAGDVGLQLGGRFGYGECATQMQEANALSLEGFESGQCLEDLSGDMIRLTTIGNQLVYKTAKYIRNEKKNNEDPRFQDIWDGALKRLTDVEWKFCVEGDESEFGMTGYLYNGGRKIVVTPGMLSSLQDDQVATLMSLCIASVIRDDHVEYELYKMDLLLFESLWLMAGIGLCDWSWLPGGLFCQVVYAVSLGTISKLKLLNKLRYIQLSRDRMALQVVKLAGYDERVAMYTLVKRGNDNTVVSHDPKLAKGLISRLNETNSPWLPTFVRFTPKWTDRYNNIKGERPKESVRTLLQYTTNKYFNKLRPLV